MQTNKEACMPYIPFEKKEIYREIVASLKDSWIGSPGELNYLFSVLCKLYLYFNKESYQSYNDIIGALECCKQELYRRKIVPYEEQKMKTNGDVY
jgi:hypothetical protein